ncbi:hypothetical protein [Gorillibacterium timonense]|uniref:hypothetical protein n=1 Tax=Gorillibacterium timonense TaxID=1689269 RepID=UPI00071D4D2F|nr:hypothetical protein [Gorillibacterium timonense]
MFDPTIYENVKVVLEGAAYDLDSDGKVLISGRKDTVDLASMSRSYRIRFTRSHADEKPEAELTLSADSEDLAAEILELRDRTPGCRLQVSFSCTVANSELECKRIDSLMKKLWGTEPKFTQTLSYEYGQESTLLRNRIDLDFQRSFDESVIGDIPRFLTHITETLARLSDGG